MLLSYTLQNKSTVKEFAYFWRSFIT
jgi:hypothetical protein